MASWLDRRVVFAVGAAQGLLALAILKFGHDGPIPLHFGLDGAPDRYGDRAEAAASLGGMALLTVVSPFLLSTLARRRGDPAPEALSYGLLIVMLVTTVVSGLIASLAFGVIGSGGAPITATMAVIGGIMAMVGGWMGKVGPNPIVGIRTPWTFASRLAWDKANRLAGRLLFWAGLACLAATPFAPQPLGLQVTIASLLVAIAAAVIESWRVWRDDPDRRGAF